MEVGWPIKAGDKREGGKLYTTYLAIVYILFISEMASPPSFSSFPDLPISQPKKAETGSSQNSAPSFSSFPELELQARRRRSRSRSKERTRDDEDEQRRRWDKERTSEKGRDRDNRKRKEKDEARVRDERRREKGSERRQSGQWEHEKGSKERRRDRGEEEGRRHREKKKHKEERGQAAERRYKEERREGERKQAEALVRGDVTVPQPTVTAVEPVKKEDGWIKEEDGVPWYETLVKARSKKRYEDFDDPVSPKLRSYQGMTDNLMKDSSSRFFVDIAGDRDILRYGSSSSFSAPKYYRDGGKRLNFLAL